ncbi:hypothetical protein PLEOSDRAFT_1109833 [Pleurotus ostreatus PC15]|uniref:Uncharacterized protein n=1 Tax=Pleurotus ostreatus (strain PC15) TaxID=1137138 RepID=A0A067N4E6_PLEO1|nr:hypothetical protein PLEOSDRAFT_1109833 [Pleurotus ostreatus PC15]
MDIRELLILSESISPICRYFRVSSSCVLFLHPPIPLAVNLISLPALAVLTSHSQAPEQCTTQFRIVLWFIFFGIFISEIILMLRTYAIWNRRRSIQITLYILCLVRHPSPVVSANSRLILDTLPQKLVFVPGLVVTQLESASLIYGPSEGGCNLEHASVIIFVAYVLLVISETSTSLPSHFTSDALLLTPLPHPKHFNIYAIPVLHGLYNYIAMDSYSTFTFLVLPLSTTWILRRIKHHYPIGFAVANVIVPVAGPVSPSALTLSIPPNHTIITQPELANWLATFVQHSSCPLPFRSTYHSPPPARSPQRIAHSVLCNRVLFLIFRQRTLHAHRLPSHSDHSSFFTPTQTPRQSDTGDKISQFFSSFFTTPEETGYMFPSVDAMTQQGSASDGGGEDAGRRTGRAAQEEEGFELRELTSS